jgi:hypothetical protein
MAALTKTTVCLSTRDYARLKALARRKTLLDRYMQTNDSAMTAACEFG